MTVPDLARALAWARGVCGVLAFVPALGCGGAAFSEGAGDGGGTSGLDGGGGSDTGSPGADGSADGGGEADAGPSYCALNGAQFELCSDFDTAALIPPWDREVTGGFGTAIKIDSAVARSAPASLLMTVAPSTPSTGTTLVQDVVIKSGIKKQNAQLQLDLDVERISLSSSDALSTVFVATVAQGTDYSVSLVLRPSSSGSSGAAPYQLAILEISGSTPTSHVLKPVPALGAWAHVTMDLNFNALQAAITVQVDANASEKVTLSPSPSALATASTRSLAVGVTITGTVADYSARLDNVTYK